MILDHMYKQRMSQCAMVQQPAHFYSVEQAADLKQEGCCCTGGSSVFQCNEG